jgi:hypothetical protein
MDHWIYEDQIDIGGYEDKHLSLGFDTSRRLLEILYNVIDDRTMRPCNFFYEPPRRRARKLAAGYLHPTGKKGSCISLLL